jgi:glycosyltransferase involved in cell wall biosynthesis
MEQPMGVVFAAAQRSCCMGVMGGGEAMLTGLPVVATDIRGPREQAESGETGLLVPPPPWPRWPRRFPTLPPMRRARMGEAGLARALGRFDEAKIIVQTLGLLGV